MSKFTPQQKWAWLQARTDLPEEAMKASPTLHFCPDWDFLCIEEGDPEFESCLCDDIEAVTETKLSKS